MQRFRFRLEALLHFRKLQTEQAQARLGEATVEWQKQSQTLQSLQSEEREAAVYFRQLQQTPVTADDFVAFHAYKQMLKNKISCQTEAVATAAAQREECRQQLAETLKRQKLVEKLKEKRLQQYNEELLRLEQKELDEIGLQLHARGE
ncbi:MAG: flagellar export protein FliJ [Sporomusaceae bacterium]|nr:flagellar export protein FliJ [Sporomusaceae bacterium]